MKNINETFHKQKLIARTYSTETKAQKHYARTQTQRNAHKQTLGR